MGTTPIIMQGFQNLLLNPERGFRIAKRFGYCKFRTLFPFLKNRNIREVHTGIPQPHYFNSSKDISFQRLILSNLWLKDMNDLYSSNTGFSKLYQNFDYDGITKTFYPTKNNAMESVNMSNVWASSWWNPVNKGRFDLYKKSDTLFADMIVNTQGVYKAKRVIENSAMHKKIAGLFESALSPHRNNFGDSLKDGSLIDSLVKSNNLYYVEYPELKDLENNQNIRKDIGG